MIVTVTGGKGGVGKSTMAWNLADELDGVVVDVDLATPDLPRGRGPDLHDVLAGRAAPMEAVERSGSVAYLPTGRTLAGARACDLSQLPAALRYLERQFGLVLVDTPAGLARDVGTAVNAADVALMVTTPHKPAIVDSMKVRDLAREVGTPVAALAINRVRGTVDAEMLDEVETEFGAPATVIEESSAIEQAQDTWSPLREMAPEADAVEAIETLAERLRACDPQSSTPADGS